MGVTVAVNYSTDWLVAAVQRLESVATSSQTFSEDDIIEFLNLELQSSVVPIIQSVNEEFGVFAYDTDVSALDDTIEIPSQATGQRLRSVQLVTSDGRLLNLQRLNPDSLGEWNAVWATGFYIRNNELVFYPRKPTGDYTLRLNYFRRPNVLVPEDEAGRVLSIDTIGGTLTLDNTPSTGWSVGQTVDIMVGSAPFDFRARAVEITDITGPVIELDPTVLAEVQVGDYVALEGESPVAQFVPLEALYLLSQLAGARCLQALGDSQGHQLAMQKAESMRLMLLNMISDRVKGQPQKIIARPITRRLRNWY